MRGVVAVALLLSLASSGCFVEEDPKTEDTGEGTGDGTSDGSSGTRQSTTSRSGTTTTDSGSTGTGAGTNHAPTAGLNATAVNGTAPLNVTFQLSGADADNDTLTWTLDFGDNATANGTSLPANVTHEFAEAGNYTVVLTVGDGQANATANVTVVVSAGAPAAPAVVEDKYVIFNPDGTCDAKGERTAGPVHLHDRADAPPQPGLVSGGGTWIYQETNSKAGLQVGGPDEDAPYKACLNPDKLIF